MAVRTNRKIVLARRPIGVPQDEDFRLETEPAPTPGTGQMLVKTLYLSLDPYMRGRMRDAKSYAAPDELGEPISGGVVGQVVASHADGFEVGDIVTAMHGWQEYAIAEPGDHRLFKVDPDLAPISTAVGATGMPGQTAYFGLLRVGEPQRGETVVVAAASGAVGGVVGQIAKIHGCRAVGIAGGKAKCDYVVGELGFDACIDHKGGTLAADLAAACPDGIDVYFENVGGEVLDAVVPLLNPAARVPICGFISAYNATEADRVRAPGEVLSALENPPSHRFFVVTEWLDEFPEATRVLGTWIREGKLKYRETVVDGLENAPRAFKMLFTGENFGKLLIKVADPE